MSWHIDEGGSQPLLRLDWTERGASAVLAREGFGTTVLQSMLHYQLDGQATRSLDAEGVRIGLTLPVRALSAPRQDGSAE